VTPVQVPEVPVGAGALVVVLVVLVEVTGLLVVVVEVIEAAPGIH